MIYRYLARIGRQVGERIDTTYNMSVDIASADLRSGARTFWKLFWETFVRAEHVLSRSSVSDQDLVKYMLPAATLRRYYWPAVLKHTPDPVIYAKIARPMISVHELLTTDRRFSRLAEYYGILPTASTTVDLRYLVLMSALMTIDHFYDLPVLAVAAGQQ